ncbi:MAG: hypothetical protein AAB861_03350 [Patescibacteria group bacterium]
MQEENEIENLDSIKPQNLGRNVEPLGVGLPPEVQSHEQKKEDLADILHKDEPLPHLRTYHGDIAEFIKSKDQSLADIALKQNEKKREEKEQEIIQQKKVEEGGSEKTKSFSELPQNFLIYIISLVLIFGAGATAWYLFSFKKSQDPVKIVEEKTIIGAKKIVTLDFSGATREGLKETFNSLRASADYLKGVTAIIISNSDTKTAIAAGDLVNGLKFNMSSALRRTLGDEFMLGLYGDGVARSFFLILKVKDYGIAFRDMLEWENDLVKDFEPMLKKDFTSTSTTYIFKDLIVKNKDTRAALSAKGDTRLIYTFLNKETVLLTESETTLKALLDAFVAGNAIR